ILCPAQVEEREDAIGLLHVLQLPDGLHPPMKRVRRHAVRSRQLRDREKTAVRDIEAVHQKPLPHGRHYASADGPAQPEKPCVPGSRFWDAGVPPTTRTCRHPRSASAVSYL